jgi:hypothetical protein
VLAALAENEAFPIFRKDSFSGLHRSRIADVKELIHVQLDHELVLLLKTLIFQFNVLRSKRILR